MRESMWTTAPKNSIFSSLKTAVCLVDIVLLLFYVLNFGKGLETAVTIGIMALLIVDLVSVSRNWIMLVIYLVFSWTYYSAFCVNYWQWYTDTFFAGFIGDDVLQTALIVMSLFIVVVSVLTPVCRKEIKIDLFSERKSSALFAILLMILLTLILIFGFGRPDESGERGSPSTLYEYSIVFFIVAFHFYGKDKWCRLGFLILALLFILQNFLFGGRVTGVQLSLVVFFFFIAQRWRKWVIVLFAVVGFSVMIVIGEQRADLSFNFGAIINAFERLWEKGGSLDTAYSSFYTSLTFLKIENLFQFGNRFQYFLKWCLSIVLGGRVDGSNLSLISREYYTHYFGGMLPMYFHFYLGLPGVLLIGGYVGYLLRKTAKLNSQSRAIWKCVAIYLGSTCFRWILYGPSNLFRGILLLAIVFVVMNFATKLFQKSSQ